ncbi:adenosylcobinamide-GDP ribazoletransferase [Phormidium yuhuli AB48]|uniref:Adenosylcobinamide-GDP ribazoletransferase n=1 Tax=Phormidium yuhuli AB48 TaxID=2940671 RepID=A0ABY5AQA6_9CYAN|nr:adenosylcobinamide-GDP ribazoletransferase [Phormidium yuhuli]USR90551.1 adenosylcobinamide-GDP ribazoletransferase [Phormidium yuhuli AB48]
MAKGQFLWLNLRFWRRQRNAIAAAIAFYTCLPIPVTWTLEFEGIAKLAPFVGIFLGGLLGLVDWGFGALGMPVLTRSALIVGLAIALTGGLHLDGAIDTADGLAVPDPQKRLAAMQDSLVGAFGTMAAVMVLLLKTVALSELVGDRALVLMAVAGWGRWGQVVAIVRYPYLKASGKGAIHKASIESAVALIPGAIALLGLSLLQLWLGGDRWLVGVGMAFGGSAIAILTPAWFNRQLGGHTGDTYGAVVEWTEALLLCLLTALAAASSP